MARYTIWLEKDGRRKVWPAVFQRKGAAITAAETLLTLSGGYDGVQVRVGDRVVYHAVVLDAGDG